MTTPFSEIRRPGLVVSVTGLGYVGLPLALAFARKCRVVGYDASSSRIAALRRADDSNREVPPELFSGCDIEFSDFVAQLRRPDVCYLAEIYAAREKNTIGISSADIARELPNGIFFADNAELEKTLRATASPGDIILTVGAGDVYKIGERLVAEGKDKV